MNDATIAAIMAVSDSLQAAWQAASAELKAISGVGTGPMGITPDAVKFSPEYRKAHYKAECARLAVHSFRKTYRKVIEKESKARIAAKRAAITQSMESSQ